MNNEKDTLRDEYDSDLIKSGTKGKFVSQYRTGTNIIVLDPELLKIFPDSAAVNRALREYVDQQKSADV